MTAAMSPAQSRPPARIRRDVALLGALLVALLATVVWPIPAQATPSSERSDDHVDYGWLYRKGDYWYSLATEDEVVREVEGVYLGAGSSTDWLGLVFTGNYCVIKHFGRGNVMFSRRGNVDLKCIIRSGNFWDKWAQTSFSIYEVVSRRPFLDNFTTYVVFDESLGGMVWEGASLDELFWGCCELEEIAGLEYLPTSDLHSVRKLFSGCSKIEDLNLTAFGTARCIDFTGMLDGCDSLITLRTGRGWSLQGAREYWFEQWLHSNKEPLVEALRLHVCDLLGCQRDDWPGDSALFEFVAEELATDEGSAEDEEPAAVEDSIEGEPVTAEGSDVTEGSDEGEQDVDEETVEDEPAADEGEQDVREESDWMDALADFESFCAEHLARFPVSMVRQEDGRRFEKGETVPDGPGTYVTADRTPVRDLVGITLADAHGEACYTDGERLTCEYAGKAVKPQVRLDGPDGPLTEGVDYTVTYDRNVEVGEATATIRCIGDYYGESSVHYDIEDTGVYALLYEDGTLYLKQGHGLPDGRAASEYRVLSARWFDAWSEAPGSSVPWADMAGEVRRVVIDQSFARISPITCRSWFEGCSNLTCVEGLGNIDVSRVTTMEGMFRGCTALQSLEGLDKLVAPHVESLEGMFCGCTALTEISFAGADVAVAGDASDFVRGCSRLARLELGGLDLSGATSTSGFLAGCGALKELSCGAGFRNAAAAGARLCLPNESYLTSPSYRRLASGAALPDGAGTYRLRDLALQLCRVEMAKGTYTCTGKALTPKMTVRLGDVTLREGADYTVTWAHNVMPGRATGTITGRGTFTGGLIVPFTIVARVTKVGDRLTYTDKQATYTLKVTKVTRKGRVAEARIVSVKVKKGSLRKLVLPNSCTIGGVKVSVTAISSRLKGSFRNVTTVVIGSSVTRIGARAFARATKVKTLTVKSARLRSAKYCLAGSKITRVNVKVSLGKAKRGKYKKWFTRSSGKSGVKVTF